MRTFQVVITSGPEVDIEAAMEKAMLILSDRIWADCDTGNAWQIEVSEVDLEGTTIPRDDLSYSFTPPDEED